MKLETFNQYQEAAKPRRPTHGTGTPEAVSYLSHGVCGEAGEFSEEVKKMIRDDHYKISKRRRERMLLELGDVLWYVTNAAKELGSSLEEVANKNQGKLSIRNAKKKTTPPKGKVSK